LLKTQGTACAQYTACTACKHYTA